MSHWTDDEEFCKNYAGHIRFTLSALRQQFLNSEDLAEDERSRIEFLEQELWRAEHKEQPYVPIRLRLHPFIPLIDRFPKTVTVVTVDLRDRYGVTQ